MNWITTNLRLPEDLYMDLKMKAAQERKSLALVIREKLGAEKATVSNAKKILARMRKLGEEIARENKGLNFTKGLIEMRYEQ
ncbi:MAG: hypothetical protein HY425_02380 [Candidatus Levybacteria bacterium]|nr:hypothetical protein [Candidatus Levybacteria bacterium]